MQVIESILADAAQIAALRRDIHAHPELCFEEQRTADLIAKQLTDWGIPIHRGMGTTGVVAILKNGTQRSRRRPARRHRRAADDRAQHVRAREHSTPARCTPAATTATPRCCSAAAKHLAKHRNYDGTVYLDLPAGRGRRRRRARDDRRTACSRSSRWRRCSARTTGRAWRSASSRSKSGPAFASSNEFRITIRGKGSHAAMPHNGIDPVPVACQMVQAFQTIITPQQAADRRRRDLGDDDPRRRGDQRRARQLRDPGHGAHLHARGARPDREAHEGDRRAHLRRVRRRVRVRVHAQLPADDQPSGRDRVRAPA